MIIQRNENNHSSIINLGVKFVLGLRLVVCWCPIYDNSPGTNVRQKSISSLLVLFTRLLSGWATTTGQGRSY